MSNDPKYDEAQQIFCLSLLANISAFYTDTRENLEIKTEEKIKAMLNDPEVKKLIGEWEVGWGPGIFQHKARRINPQDVADNTLYVAKAKNHEKYVVAIAGTVDTSAYDWLSEDLKIELKPWVQCQDKSRYKPVLAQGIHTGLTNLLGITPSVGPQKNTIMNFFKEVYKNAANQVYPEIITTGHSLGGSLSPALALWLKDTQIKVNKEPDRPNEPWNPKGNAVIKTYPSAGVQLGNDETRNYFDTHFGKENVHIIWNDKDIIPHLWSNLQDYISLFKKNNNPYAKHILKRLKLVMDFIEGFAPDDAPFSEYRHIPASTSTKLSGVLQLNKIENLEELLDELAYQHVDEYLNKWNLEEFAKLFKKLIGYGPAEILTFYMSDTVMERLKQRTK